MPLRKEQAKKRTPRKTSSRKKISKTTSRKPKEQLIGKVAHYYDKIGVIALKLGAPLKAGDTIRIEGGTTSFTQKVSSMQIEHESVKSAKKGADVGIKVSKKAREGYRVFRIAAG